MNIYFYIILLALLGAYAVNLVADLLNLSALTDRIPEEFQGVYDPEKYRRSQDYARSRLLFGIAASTFDLAKILAFWLAGGFNLLDRVVQGWGLPLIPSGLAYVGLLVAANEILSLPFSAYSTFVIEEKFGFNRTTVKTFISDLVKGYLIGAVLGAALLAGVLYFLNWAGAMAWLYIWIGGSLFTLALQFVAPTWIMPLFNKFTPLGDGDLKTAILEYARSVGFPLKGIFVMDGSRRSTKTNAFFTGFGKNKRIALFDTLIAQHSVQEMTAILAHEIGHYKMRHILKGMVISILHFGILSYLLSFFIKSPGLFAAFMMEDMPVYAGLIFFGLLYTPISFVLSILLQMYSRHNEYEADRYSVETYGNPEALVRSLKTLSVTNLSNLTPHPFYAFLKYTHPPVLARIRALRR